MLSTPIHYRPATPKESPMNMECIVGSIRCASGGVAVSKGVGAPRVCPGAWQGRGALHPSGFWR